MALVVVLLSGLESPDKLAAALIINNTAHYMTILEAGN